MTIAAAHTEAVIGFREWIVEDSVLLPPAAGVAWVPGVNTARCYGHGACNSVPGSACDCGLYAMHAPPDELEDYLIGPGAMVIGAIAAWGRLQVHADGFRAEHARVVALAYPPQATPATIARLAPAAARYEVELVAFEDLPAVASQHGTGVAPSGRRGRRARALGLPLPRTARGSAFPASTRGEPAEGWERQVVDPTPAARRATRDQVYLLIGWPRVLFHLRVFEAPGHPAIVIAGNLDGRTGGSVSNNAAGIAAEIAARVLPGEDFAFIEHYPLRHDDGAVYATDGFTAVTFDSDGRAQWGRSLSHEAVEALVGQPVVIFPAGAYTAENVERVKSAPHAQLAADAQLPSCPQHGRRGDFYCAEVVMACYARHARQQRRYRPPMPAALAWLRGGRYEGHDEGPVSVVLGAPRVLSSPDGSGRFGWGYGGSGAQELAAAILADWHGHAVAGDLTRDFAGQVIASLPPQRFELSFEEIAAWMSQRPEHPSRGLVFVAAMASGMIHAHTCGFWIARELAEHGFEVYLPEYAHSQAQRDPFAAATIASHRGALNRASAIVVPFGLPAAAPPTVEAALALDYAQREETTALVIAALDEGASLPAAREHFALMGAEVTACPGPRDIDGKMTSAAVREILEQMTAAPDQTG